MDALESFQNWYASHCDGEWEHSFGVKIQTLDNPGWSVQINLIDTELEGRDFIAISEQNDREHDQEPDRWIECFVRDNVWNGVGDETKLARILTQFLTWAKSPAFGNA
jgi:hypothetical protein